MGGFVDGGDISDVCKRLMYELGYLLRALRGVNGSERAGLTFEELESSRVEGNR